MTSLATAIAAIAQPQLTKSDLMDTLAAMPRSPASSPPRAIERLRGRLTAALAPSRLEIVDDSHRHAGHAGARPGGESHFHVTIVAAVFAGKSRVARQRLVLDALAEELANGVHALGITALAPNDPASEHY